MTEKNTNLTQNTTSELKGNDTMSSEKPMFDLQAALATPSGVTWDPSSFLIDHVHTLEDAKNSQKPIKYIMGEDGQVYEMHSTELGDFTVKTNKVKGADKVKEGLSLNIPKIPFKLLLQAISFFRDVCGEFNNDEAMLQFWFNKETQEFFAECLEQTTNKVHVTYLRNKELEENPNMVLVMDIHSHNTMDAFWSGTDDASEQETRTYGVIGRLDKAVPSYKFRMSVVGQFLDMKMDQLFEMPKLKLFAAGVDVEEELSVEHVFFPQVDYPKEWLTVVEEGKRSSHRFSGKGNPNSRRVGTGLSRPTYRYPHLDSVSDDAYANASQMSLFNEDEVNARRSNYQQKALQNREGFGYDEDRSDQFIDLDDDTMGFNQGFDIDPQAEEFMGLLIEQLDGFEDSDQRVHFLAGLISNFSMFEVKMLVDRMIEIGHDQEIIDQLKTHGYQVKQ